MSMGDSWSYVKDDNYKTTNTLIHTLVDVVSKGGNFLLNVGPDQYGAIPDTALSRMREMGDWLKTNGKAIYSTRACSPYVSGKWRFTQSKDHNTIYAIYLLDQGEDMPEVVTLPTLNRVPTGASVVGGGSAKLKIADNAVQVYVHPSKKALHAVAIALTFEEKK